MSRRIEYRLNDEQLSQIEQAINGSPYPEVRQRAIAVRMLHLGQKPEQVAEVMMVTSATVYAWHKRWREAGLSGLQDQPRSGRPAKADADYLEKLDQALEADPRQLGLPFTIWTINRLRLYLSEQTGILLSYTRFRALLSRLGYRWKQTKHDLSHLQNATAKEVMAEVTDWLKKTSRLTRLPTPNSSLWTKPR
jgi:putative transposase